MTRLTGITTRIECGLAADGRGSRELAHANGRTCQPRGVTVQSFSAASHSSTGMVAGNSGATSAGSVCQTKA
jgi:hypothetical protein